MSLVEEDTSSLQSVVFHSPSNDIRGTNGTLLNGNSLDSDSPNKSRAYGPDVEHSLRAAVTALPEEHAVHQDSFEMRGLAQHLHKLHSKRTTPRDEGHDSTPISLEGTTQLEANSVLSDGQKRVHARRRAMHFAVLCWLFFLSGWNDGSTGPLLPKIQEHYGVGFFESLVCLCIRLYPLSTHINPHIELPTP